MVTTETREIEIFNPYDDMGVDALVEFDVHRDSRNVLDGVEVNSIIYNNMMIHEYLSESYISRIEDKLYHDLLEEE